MSINQHNKHNIISNNLSIHNHSISIGFIYHKVFIQHLKKNDIHSPKHIINHIKRVHLHSKSFTSNMAINKQLKTWRKRPNCKQDSIHSRLGRFVYSQASSLVLAFVLVAWPFINSFYNQTFHIRQWINHKHVPSMKCIITNLVTLIPFLTLNQIFIYSISCLNIVSFILWNN